VIPQLPKSSSARAAYSEAQCSLQGSLERASEGFQAACAGGDLDSAERWIRRLEDAERSLDALRTALPRRDRDLMIAEQILGSLEQERLGVFERFRRQPFWRLTIPEGVSDLDALAALDTKMRERYPHSTSMFLQDDVQSWLMRHGGAGTRDVSKARNVQIVPVVLGTLFPHEEQQRQALARRGMIQAEIIEVALVCMAYACTHDGADVLKGRSVRAPGTSYFLQFQCGLSFCLWRLSEARAYAAGALTRRA